MALARRICPTPVPDTYAVLDDLIWYLNFCTVCHEVMLEIYRCDIVIEKCCKDCRPFVDILEFKMPFLYSDSHPRYKKCVSICREQVDSDNCDICMLKQSLKVTLEALLDMHKDNQACAQCLAVLNRQPDGGIPPKKTDLPMSHQTEPRKADQEASSSPSSKDSHSSMSISAENEDDQEWGIDFSPVGSPTPSDLEFSASFTYLSYSSDEANNEEEGATNNDVMQ